MRLQNRIAIITGGSRGIGLATAKTFAREQAQVVVWDLQESDALPEGSLFQKVDVADFTAAQEAAQAVVDRFGKIDILVNNAGITRDATLLKMEEDQFDQVVQVNLKGVYNCTRAVVPYMAENGFGRILSASSVVGLYGNFGQTNYVATKAGVIGMTKVWARELGRKGITANVVAPGFIATEMAIAVPEKVLHLVQEKTPLGRLGKPEDVASAYLFLASDEASFINGAVLSVDGGLVL